MTIPSPSPGSLADYKVGRDAICATYNAQVNPLKTEIKRIYDPALPSPDRTVEVQALTNLVTLSEAMTVELDGLVPPASLAADHAVDIARYQQINALIRQQFPLIDQGSYAAAEALDLATDPIALAIGAFERQNSLRSCP